MAGGAYSVSKLALDGLTWSLRRDLGGGGITVNGVAPGATDNEATRRQVPADGFQMLTAQQALSRPGESRGDYATIRHLCSEEAGWCTGQTLYVNDGFDVSY